MAWPVPRIYRGTTLCGEGMCAMVLPALDCRRLEWRINAMMMMPKKGWRGGRRKVGKVLGDEAEEAVNETL